jgi:hypothetical protein
MHIGALYTHFSSPHTSDCSTAAQIGVLQIGELRNLICQIGVLGSCILQACSTRAPDWFGFQYYNSELE